MALKATLANLEGLDEGTKKLYSQGEKGFVLDLDGIDDHPSVGALRRAKDHEKEARKKATEEANTRIAALESEREGFLKGAIPKGDVDKLELSYKEKLSKRDLEAKAEADGLRGTLSTLLVDNVATSLAASLAKDPSLTPRFIPHIRGRLRAEIVDGQAVTRVLDKDGKPSALTVDELKAEFVANPAFAPIIVGSKATGSGAEGGHGSGGARSTKKVDYSKASAADIAADIKAKKEAL
jgi:hypothetical protein